MIPHVVAERTKSCFEFIGLKTGEATCSVNIMIFIIL